MRATWVVAGLMCAGCVSTAKFQPATVSAPGRTSNDLYRAAVRVLSDREEIVDDKDSQAGLIVTQWKTVDMAFVAEVQVRWKVFVDDGGVKVASDCRTKHENNIDKCGDQPEGRTQEAQQLAEAIADEVNRVPPPASVAPVTPAPPPVTAPPPAPMPDAGPPPQ